MQKQGENFRRGFWNQLGIETNARESVAMGKSVSSPRFLWVPFVDALMLPLNTESYREIKSDNLVFYQAKTVC